MLQTNQCIFERRIEKRLSVACFVFVRGITQNGKCIKIHTLTDNLSQGGLYLQSPYPLKLGSHVFTFARLLSGAGLVARGCVVGINEKEHGLYGIAVCFSRPRLIPLNLKTGSK